MIIAREKKKTNIAEYVLYMWQLEDLIRANHFDINRLENTLISKFDQPENVINEIRDWYSNLIIMMKEENIEKKGHLQFVKNTMNDMYDVHLRLLDNNKQKTYHDLFAAAYKNIEEFAEKAGLEDSNPIEICFNALYSFLLIKLQNKEVSRTTLNAMQSFSNVLAYLSKAYKEFNDGEIEL